MSKSSLASMSLPEKAKLLSKETTFISDQDLGGSNSSDEVGVAVMIGAKSLFVTSTLMFILGFFLLINMQDDSALSMTIGLLALLIMAVSLLTICVTGIFQFAGRKNLKKAKKYLAKINAPTTLTNWKSSSSNSYHYDIYKRGIKISQKSRLNLHLAMYSPMNIFSRVAIAEELRYDVEEDIYYKNTFYTSWRGLCVETESFSGPRYSIRQAIKNI